MNQNMEPLSLNGMNVNDAAQILLRAQTMAQEEKLSFFRRILEQDSEIQSERRKLLREIMEYVKLLGNKADRYEDAVWLGLTLSALLDDQSEYIEFSKMELRLLMKQGKMQEAQDKLAEWKSILPNDPYWEQLSVDFQSQQTLQAVDKTIKITEMIFSKEVDTYPAKWIVAGLGINNGGFLAAAVNRLMQSSKRPEIVACCDASGSDCGKNVQANNKSLPIIDLNTAVRRCQKDQDGLGLLVAEHPLRISTILTALRYSKLKNVYLAQDYVYWDSKYDLLDELHRVPVERPMLSYFEFQVCSHCNLNCYQCGNFSNLITEPEWGDFDQYERDVKRLSELFWNAGNMRFQGGEPMLNPRLPDYFRVTREAFPAANIGILSNGLLIPKAKPELFEAMRKYKVSFNLSGYPPTYEMKDKIEKRCAEEGVFVHFWPKVTEWREISLKVLNMPPSSDWKAAEKWWRTCQSKDSHILHEGYLYYCCRSHPTIPKLYERFGLDIKENYMWQHLDDIRFDLSDSTLDGWVINEKLNHVHEACLYCVNQKPNFRITQWRTCPSSQAKLEDYWWDPPCEICNIGEEEK